jgi:hypothetical protein
MQPEADTSNLSCDLWEWLDITSWGSCPCKNYDKFKGTTNDLYITLPPPTHTHAHTVTQAYISLHTHAHVPSYEYTHMEHIHLPYTRRELQ